jgi:hypothetical protein
VEEGRAKVEREVERRRRTVLENILVVVVMAVAVE